MEISNWSQYKDWIETTLDNERDYLFRGQLDPAWKLKTSFHRHASALKYSMDQYVDFLIPSTHHYVSATYREKFDLVQPDEFGAFLALLQHHGYPTPLLDWTLSPYIAAYFAFRDVNAKDPQVDSVKIYIFDHIEWTKTYDQPLDLRLKEPFVSVLQTHARNNQRMIAQNGVYTASNIEDIEAYLISLGASKNKSFLNVITLPVHERNRVIRDLSLMGINEMTLFPGIDGVCRSMKETHFAPPYVGLSPMVKAMFKKK